MKVSGKTLLSSKGREILPSAAQHSHHPSPIHCVISDNIKGVEARPAEQREVSGKADRLWKRSDWEWAPPSQSWGGAGERGAFHDCLYASADGHGAVLFSCLSEGHLLKVSHKNQRRCKKKGLRLSSLISLTAKLINKCWLPCSVKEKEWQTVDNSLVDIT